MNEALGKIEFPMARKVRFTSGQYDRDVLQPSPPEDVQPVKRIIERILRVIGIRAAEQPRRQVARLRLSGGRLQVDRRRETRSPKISSCTYGLMRSVDRDGVMLEEGNATAVDDSPTGMRLLLGIAPSEGQILEIQTDHVTLGRATSLVEVCWTKPLVYDEDDALYLVGCRVSFGPMRTKQPSLISS